MKPQMQFLSLPNAPIEEANVLILPVPHERTVTYGTGTAAAPRAILAASEQLEFYEEDRGWCPTQYMKLSVLEPHHAENGEPDAEFYRRLRERVAALPSEALFIALGGEHSITPEMVFARMPVGGTIVQIDAHADLRSTYHGSEYNHACPMYRLKARGYRLLQIGIRSLHEKEARLINEDQAISCYFDRRLQSPVEWQRLLVELASLQGDVWFTVDMDGFDPALIPGVGTPQPGGLNWHQGLDILEHLTANGQIDLRGIDIVELVPEASRVSDMLAAKWLQKCISYWGMARDFARRPAQGSQVGVNDE